MRCCAVSKDSSSVFFLAEPRRWLSQGRRRARSSSGDRARPARSRESQRRQGLLLREHGVGVDLAAERAAVDRCVGGRSPTSSSPISAWELKLQFGEATVPLGSPHRWRARARLKGARLLRGWRVPPSELRSPRSSPGRSPRGPPSGCAAPRPQPFGRRQIVVGHLCPARLGGRRMVRRAADRARLPGARPAASAAARPALHRSSTSARSDSASTGHRSRALRDRETACTGLFGPLAACARQQALQRSSC